MTQDRYGLKPARTIRIGRNLVDENDVWSLIERGAQGLVGLRRLRLGKQDIDADNTGACVADIANEFSEQGSRPGPAAILPQAFVIDEHQHDRGRSRGMGRQTNEGVVDPAIAIR